MIKQLSQTDIEGIQFGEVAVALKGPTYFSSTFGIQFSEEADDFDTYVNAILSTEAGVVFTLSKYRCAKDVTQIHLDKRVANRDGIKAFVEEIGREFGIPDDIVQLNP